MINLLLSLCQFSVQHLLLRSPRLNRGELHSWGLPSLVLLLNLISAGLGLAYQMLWVKYLNLILRKNKRGRNIT